MRTFNTLIFALRIFLPEKILGQGNSSVEMADAFRKDGKIYVVVLALVIILTGVCIFLIRVDRKIFKLEKKFEKRK